MTLLRPWIANSFSAHDKRHGADLTAAWTGTKYVQIVKFETYRTDQDPRAVIRGIVSDSTHYIDVFFNLQATDDFERPIPEVGHTPLTSHLRSILQILEFKYHLSRAPPPASAQDLPLVSLEIRRWKIVSGDRNDPVLFPSAQSVGKGNGEEDEKVKAVLRKWWFGESLSDHSQAISAMGPKLTANASVASSTSSVPAPVQSTTMTTLSDFLAPYIKKNKTIPAWVFDVPDDQREELDMINMFGLDPDRDEGRSDHKPEGGEGAEGMEREEGQDVEEVEVNANAAELGQGDVSMTSAADAEEGANKVEKPGQNEDEDDDEIPIRPLPRSRRSIVTDPLSFDAPLSDSQPTPESIAARRPPPPSGRVRVNVKSTQMSTVSIAPIGSGIEVQEDGEEQGGEDDEGLSDYEREQRASRRRNSSRAQGEGGEKAPKDEHDEHELEREDEGEADLGSLSQSQDSKEFRLTGYSQPSSPIVVSTQPLAASAASAVSAISAVSAASAESHVLVPGSGSQENVTNKRDRAEVLVPTSDESLPRKADTQSQSLEHAVVSTHPVVIPTSSAAVAPAPGPAPAAEPTPRLAVNGSHGHPTPENRQLRTTQRIVSPDSAEKRHPPSAEADDEQSQSLSQSQGRSRVKRVKVEVGSSPLDPRRSGGSAGPSRQSRGVSGTANVGANQLNSRAELDVFTAAPVSEAHRRNGSTSTFAHPPPPTDYVQPTPAVHAQPQLPPQPQQLGAYTTPQRIDVDPPKRLLLNGFRPNLVPRDGLGLLGYQVREMMRTAQVARGGTSRE